MAEQQGISYISQAGEIEASQKMSTKKGIKQVVVSHMSLCSFRSNCLFTDHLLLMNTVTAITVAMLVIQATHTKQLLLQLQACCRTFGVEEGRSPGLWSARGRDLPAHPLC